VDKTMNRREKVTAIIRLMLQKEDKMPWLVLGLGVAVEDRPRFSTLIRDIFSQ
jgi:hypothetical protein